RPGAPPLGRGLAAGGPAGEGPGPVGQGRRCRVGRDTGPAPSGGLRHASALPVRQTASLVRRRAARRGRTGSRPRAAPAGARERLRPHRTAVPDGLDGARAVLAELFPRWTAPPALGRLAGDGPCRARARAREGRAPRRRPPVEPALGSPLCPRPQRGSPPHLAPP